jgi:hypothetical protein
MAARRKSLWLLVRDQTFLARRHAERLLEEPLLEDPGLRYLQLAYRRARGERRRREFALYFERAVRNPIDRVIWALPADQSERPPARRRGRPAKTLLQHVLDNSFAPTRHARLLDSEPLPDECPLAGGERLWAALLSLQGEYADASDVRSILAAERLRSSIAADFAAFVHALHGRRLPPRLRHHGRDFTIYLVTSTYICFGIVR